jgi:hypothetical protein
MDDPRGTHIRLVPFDSLHDKSLSPCGALRVMKTEALKQ